MRLKYTTKVEVHIEHPIMDTNFVADFQGNMYILITADSVLYRWQRLLAPNYENQLLRDHLTVEKALAYAIELGAVVGSMDFSPMIAAVRASLKPADRSGN